MRKYHYCHWQHFLMHIAYSSKNKLFHEILANWLDLLIMLCVLVCANILISFLCRLGTKRWAQSSHRNNHRMNDYINSIPSIRGNLKQLIVNLNKTCSLKHHKVNKCFGWSNIFRWVLKARFSSTQLLILYNYLINLLENIYIITIVC